MLLRLLIPILLCIQFALTAQSTGCFNLMLTQARAVSGDTLAIDVRVKGFKQVLLLGYQTVWDNRVLQLVEISNRNPMLPQTSFEAPPFFSVNGISWFSWQDPFYVGQNLPDDTRIYTLNFLVIDPSARRTKIAIGGPSISEIAYSFSSEFYAEYLPATVAVNAILKEDLPKNALQFNQICTTVQKCGIGQINAPVNGGIPPYSFFIKGNDGKFKPSQLNNLTPGFYHLIAVDGQKDSIEALINLNPSPTGSGVNLQAIVTCDPQQADSATILVNVSGARGRYAFDWSEGTYAISTGKSRIKIANNQLYSVTVTDTRGCEAVLENLNARACLVANDSIPQLSLESSNRLNGELFCSKVELANAQDLSTIQFALRWNSDKIAFQHFNIIDPQLLSSNFGIDDVNRGVLYFSKKNETKFSTPRQSLFELCFQAQNRVDTGYISFDEQSLALEVLDANKQPLPIRTYAASIEINAAIWPGDTDRNGMVNHFDLLPIGLAYGNRGAVRPNSSLEWQAQATHLWGKNISGFDLAFIDTDGTGRIESKDTSAILVNWQRSYTKALIPTVSPLLKASATPLNIRQDTLRGLAAQTLSIDLGSTSAVASNVYGLAFSIGYNPAEVNEQSLRFSSSSSWLGTLGDDLLTIQRNDLSKHQLEVALVRTDQQNRNGFGQIGQLHLALDRNEIRPTLQGVNLSINNIRLIDRTGHTLAVLPSKTSLPISRLVNTSSLSADLQQHIKLYPQPASQHLWVDLGGLDLLHWQLLTLNGQVVKTGLSLHAPVELSHLPAGMYVLKMVCSQGIALKKCLITHN
jgi:hypothetical protein